MALSLADGLLPSLVDRARQFFQQQEIEGLKLREVC